MGWENRNGSLYYYRKERDGGRVRSVYIGRHPDIVAAVEMFAEEDREQRDEQRRADREMFAELDRVQAMADQSLEGADGLLGAVLVAEGYHQHKGQWRKSR